MRIKMCTIVHLDEIPTDYRTAIAMALHDIDAWLKSAESRRGTDPYRAFEIEHHGGAWLWVTETM